MSRSKKHSSGYKYQTGELRGRVEADGRVVKGWVDADKQRATIRAVRRARHQEEKQLEREEEPDA